MKKTIEVYRGDNGFTATPKEFLEFWEDIFSKIPEEYLEEAIVNLEPDSCYDIPILITTVGYRRPESQEETEKRELEESQRRESIKENELRIFKRIKEKYNL